MLKTTYTMVVPGLIQSREHAKDPALKQWLAKAKEEHVPASYYDLLLELFGYPKAAYNFARLRALYDGLDIAFHWICADPIHLAVDVAHVYSLGNAYLDLSLNEAQNYVNELNKCLPKEFTLYAPHPLRWYIKLDQSWQIDCAFPDEILAKTIIDKLPQGKDALPAKLLFNEIQMLLHDLSINRQRCIESKPTVDALWLWGAGRDMERSQSLDWDYVQSNDAMALALAQLNDIKTASSTEDVSGNVLFIDTQYQFRDVNEGRTEQAKTELKKLYVGNGLAYSPAGGRVRNFCQSIISKVY